MASNADHYRKAEALLERYELIEEELSELLDKAQHSITIDQRVDDLYAEKSDLLARAQIHATLATAGGAQVVTTTVAAPAGRPSKYRWGHE